MTGQHYEWFPTKLAETRSQFVNMRAKYGAVEFLQILILEDLE